jgi:regulatory protein
VKKGGGDCFRESLRIVSRRQYSVMEVREKLLKKGFGEGRVEESVSKLKDYGYLDDGELAKSLVYSKFHSAGYGRRKIRQYLRKRKIPENIIESELEESVSRREAIERGVELLGRKQQRAEKKLMWEKGRVLRFLAGRGFELGECIDIIAEYEKTMRKENDGEGS